MLNLNLEHKPSPPPKRDFRIGVIGAGFIVDNVQLVAYANAGYNVQAIASANPEQSRSVAQRHKIPRVYDTWRELVADTSIEIVDLAVPPVEQPAILEELPRIGGHIKGVLAQKSPSSGSTEQSASSWSTRPNPAGSSNGLRKPPGKLTGS